MSEKEKKAKQEEQEQKQEQQQQTPPPKPYCPAPPLPSIPAVDGITFDFNDGMRVKVPKNAPRKYRIVFADLDGGNIVYSSDVEAGAYVASVKKYYINWKLMIYEQDKFDKPIFEHEFDCEGKDVLIPVPEGAIGDTVAWLSYIVRFQQKTKCNLYLVMVPFMRELFQKQYPEFHWITKEEAEKIKPYATYRVGLYFCDENWDFQPVDFRKTGLHHCVGYMLGLEKELGDYPPKVDLSAPRQIQEKYAVIATKASSACKFWNNFGGWREVVQHLKENGYRVLCIDKDHEVGTGTTFYGMPYGAEDFTGAFPLQERINLIKDADLFIGCSSGLAWLAWCCLPKDRIIMINTFTEVWNEFDCRHVQNIHACHGCWNDTRYQFQHKDFLWCPRYEEPNDLFQCGRMISGGMVNAEIDQALRINK